MECREIMVIPREPKTWKPFAGIIDGNLEIEPILVFGKFLKVSDALLNIFVQFGNIPKNPDAQACSEQGC